MVLWDISLWLRIRRFKRCFALRYSDVRVWVLKWLYGAVTRSERYSVCHVVVLCFQVYEILLYKGANWGSIILRDRSVTSYTAISALFCF